MPTFGQLTRQKIVDVQVDVGDGDVFTIRFDRNKVTPAWVDEADRTAKAGEDALVLAGAIADVMLGWDVTNEDGSELAPSRETLGKLPFAVLTVLLEQLVTASAPSRAEGNASTISPAPPSGMSEQGSVSSLTGPAVTPPNGQAGSVSPAPSASPLLT